VISRKVGYPGNLLEEKKRGAYSTERRGLEGGSAEKVISSPEKKGKQT